MPKLYSEKTNPPPIIPSVNALTVDPPNQPAPSHPPVSAIYDNLHTNLPKNVMAFRDIPFPDDYPLFPNRKQVTAYIQTIAEQCDLLPMIRFNTTVVRAEPCSNNKWELNVTEWRDDKETSYKEIYDAVIVASGHYYIPYVPEFEGLKDFTKVSDVIHSRDYRKPQDFTNKTILVVGNGSSSSDLVREISTHAVKVYHCVRGEETSFSRTLAENMPKNTERVVGLSKFDASKGVIECQDGKQIQNVDTIIFATGYLYSFPFLPFEEDRLIVDGQKVLGLYDYMFYIDNPTLSFVGLPIRVVPMPLMQLQSTLIARCYSGKIQLPSQEVMEESIANETNDRKELVMNVTKELAYVDRMGAIAEGYHGDIEDWKSTDIITGRLSEEWREDRVKSLELRRKHLGY
ncbi:flavin-binding monooxygenase-like-domain-containing protein [Circinella umbellata]|nr:flavin-binding monooxygenase-like-domain-containing protein [Circinella umbellata]